jgi:hypothetical protein
MFTDALLIDAAREQEFLPTVMIRGIQSVNMGKTSWPVVYRKQVSLHTFRVARGI